MDNLEAMNVLHKMMQSEDEEIAKAHSLACQALNEKVPMYCRIDNAGGLHCPCCDNLILRSGLTHFCNKCGQAIRWRRNEKDNQLDNSNVPSGIYIGGSKKKF